MAPRRHGPQLNAATLAQSLDMAPVQGAVEVAIPAGVLWDCIARADLWPRWNTCMYAARNRRLVQGERLLWAFDPLRWWLPYKLPGVAKIVDVQEGRSVTWEVTALPGFYARHTYFIEDLGEGRSRFGSWEKAMGPTFEVARAFWLNHFHFVLERSLQGVRYLESVYRREQRLDETTLPSRDYVPLAGALRAAARPVAALWPRYEEVARGVYAALGGGGNSLVVHDGREVLLVDTKLPPFSGLLKRWITRNIGAPVTTVVNTHFHYDHTFGNRQFSGARIVAHESAPALMRERDGARWRNTSPALPQRLVEDGEILMVGEQKATVHHDGAGHTASDLWLHLRRDGLDIIATGDVASLDIYPFLDLGPGGCDVPAMIDRLRAWAERYPQAVFVPGHGRLATAADLRQHAAYLSALWKQVARARSDGLSEDRAVKRINLSRYRLGMMPIFHYEESVLSAASNVRAVYRLQEREAGGRKRLVL